FSPDGKKLLFIGSGPEKSWNLSVIDLLLGKTTVLAKLDHRWDFAACWSPDCRHIACSSVEADENLKRTGLCRLEIYDAHAKGRPVVLREESNETLTVTDWR